MNDYPSSQEERDEDYFSSSSFRRDVTDARSSHADALHADALGRDITAQDVARPDYPEASSIETGAVDSLSTNVEGASLPMGAAYQTGEALDERAKPEREERLYGSHQSIGSTYFNITNANDGPVAGLNVLMDSKGQAVRSELYLYEDSSEADKQEAIRQANLLLKNQFSSHYIDADKQLLELRIFETQQKYATVYVDLPENAPAATPSGFGGGFGSGSKRDGHNGGLGSGRLGTGGLGSGGLSAEGIGSGLSGGFSRLWPLALAALTLLLGIGIIWWVLSNFLGGGGLGLSTNDAQNDAATEAVAGEVQGETQASTNFDPNQPILNVAANQGESTQTEVVQGQAAQDSGQADQGEVVQGQAAGQSVSVQPVQLEWVNPSEENRNGLPQSVKADPSIGRSSRVNVLPGIQIMLRSHPGPAAGTEVGVMQEGDTGIVVGGPYYTEGESDTIVWWYVRLDDGTTEAWVAANTSTLTLLEPAQ